MTREEKQKELEKVAAEIAATGGGPLACPGINPVPGEGNPDARILWVGEGPGATENELGRPFVGVSGRLLRKAMAENGFSEKDVFITNIVKFRPPENRDPTPEEIEFFRPFLDRQIEIIDPEIIVTLGRYSMFKFLGEGISISRIHGAPRTIDWNGKKITIFPMFHPAAALRAGEMMSQFLADFKKLYKLLQLKKPEFPSVSLMRLTKTPAPTEKLVPSAKVLISSHSTLGLKARSFPRANYNLVNGKTQTDHALVKETKEEKLKAKQLELV